MPRRKKTDQSPARLPDGPPPEWGSLGHNTGYPAAQPAGYQASTTGSYFIPSGTSISSADKEKVVKSMQEMFYHLDQEVIYIVLSECDFKVENAMDSLLELSVAAEVAAPVPSPVSGFERTAAALLNPGHFSEAKPEDAQQLSSLSSCLLTEDLDLLVDRELETLTARPGGMESHQSSIHSDVDLSLASLPPPPPPPSLLSQQDLPELLQSSLESGTRGPSAERSASAGRLAERLSAASSPLDQLSTWEKETTKDQPSVVDFSHLTTGTPPDKASLPFDLAASGRPSAFQVYKKLEPPQAPSEGPGLLYSDAVGGARAKTRTLNQDPPGYVSSHWNLDAPLFSPQLSGNQGRALNNPGAQTAWNWSGQPSHASPWLNAGPVSQAPLKPHAAIPKSWAPPAAPQAPSRHSRLHLEGKVLVLLRGAPGSGKSTLARALLYHNPGGVALCTDDYFIRNDQYHFDPTLLGEAHDWNHKRAKEAFEMGKNPIIIDNTNMQGWEMRPYVIQALRHGYKVLFKEPDTWWKNKPRELQRRSAHDVPVETIRRMLTGYERFVTVHSIMGSHMPEWKHRVLLENKSSQLLSSESPCPDLVDQPSLTEHLKKSRSQLFSSLPDVSSIGHSLEVVKLEEGSHKSSESLNFQVTPGPADDSDREDVDLGELDSELDAMLELDANNPAGDLKMPDCIVESVMNEDHCVDDLPVAFSTSIKQRVNRERPSRRSEFDRTDPVDLVKDVKQLDREADGKEKLREEKAEGAEMVRHEGEKATSKLLDFVGDWPSEGPLNQRQVRKRAGQVHNNDCSSEEDKKGKSASVPSGPNGIELQKLLDLIQTGAVADPADSSHSHSISPDSGEELERDDEAGGRSEESQSSGSNSEDRKRGVKQGRSELPDCVLGWKAAESCMEKQSKDDHLEGLRIESEGSSAGSSELVKEALSERHSVDSEAGTHVDLYSGTDVNREQRTKADVSGIVDACQSPECESESGSLTGGSQEKKQRQGRRSGKQCKLALTFTQNYSDSSLNTVNSPNNSSQSLLGAENCSSDFDVGLKPNPELLSESEADLRPPTPPLLEDTGCFTQTEPQDFALLWRLNRKDGPEDSVVTASSRRRSDVTVMCGEASRFAPEVSSAVSAAVAVHPSGHREVPYRVVHEKGTQVEEREFGVTQDCIENLRILSRHFKLVSFDTLEDLYDKCQQDLEWTTNLLLDSGERFFRDEDGIEEEEEKEEVLDVAAHEDDDSSSRLCEALLKTSLCPNDSEEKKHENKHVGTCTVMKEGTQLSTCEGHEGFVENASNTDPSSFKGGGDTILNKDQTNSTTNLEKAPEREPRAHTAVKEEERCDNTLDRVTSEGGGAAGASDNGVVIEELRDQIEDEIASMDEVNRLLQGELDEMEEEENRRKERRRGEHLDIQSVELKLPTELALQLTELFGPVGVDPGECSAEDCSVQMDLNLAKLLHHKWKETIQERQKQATLSFHLLQEGAARLSDAQVVKPGQRDRTPPTHLTPQDSRPEAARGPMAFMDHWNVSQPRVSLRDIINEEKALQRNVEKTRENRADLDRRDGATLLKENQLFSLFPNIDKHFLLDIFRDHNYSLVQTELFLRSLLMEEPVKTVVAPEAPRSTQMRGTSKERDKRQKPLEAAVAAYQDTEDPEYEDFRAEASLQRRRQLESFSKAAEAHKQGRKEVASFYAQQGHLHGQRMREANHRAAAQIFERVNSSLLPNNILDLHGLHVDEALQHLAQVLQDKTADSEQGLCRPQLSVITGRGNHSQGGVARIRPAVVDYLTNKHYRFTEPKLGLVLVSLK